MNYNNYTRKPVGRRTKIWFFFLGIILSIILFYSGNKVMKITSTNKYCISCHIHPTADQSWKMSTHHNNSSGVIVNCVDCHLPPKGEGYFFAKAKTGLKDLYGFYFKDSAEINWEKKKLLENAKGISL